MDGSPLRIYNPQEGEALDEYFKRYTDEELLTIVQHPTLSVQLSNTLLNQSEYIRAKPTDEFQRIWDEVKHLSNYGRLKHFVDLLITVRSKLLRSLDEYARNIELYAKRLSVMRMVCCVSDIAGSIGGILLKDSQPEYSNLAFTAAAGFGFFGTFTTVAEAYLMINASDDIMQQIRKDQKRYEPIEEWFRQTKRLEKAMLDAFPFDITKEILEDFSQTVNMELRGADLFIRFVRKVAEFDVKALRNLNLLRNMISFFSRPDATDLCKLVIFQQDPPLLEVSKMLLQLTYSPDKHIFYQHIPSLSPSKQTFWSPPVWGRISFNILGALHAFRTLQRSEISTIASEMRNVRQHLEAQMIKLQQITEYVESQRLQQQH